MSPDTSRREFAVAVLSAPSAFAVEPENQEKNPLEAARQGVRAAARELEKLDLPMTTEPAFLFKP
jgi:hypothetical protein